MGGTDRPTRQQGAFVYTGSGRNQPDDAPIEQRLCKDQACAIQRCLARSNFKEAYCKEDIAAWRACCERARALEAGQQSPADPHPAATAPAAEKVNRR
mmetsp:Transcript_4881/g.16079  ORF Transcript_4881/g.16079 Transcript_4881/m.16079 type:complete len:98 (-) Transcript_4881:495-788(-)